MTTREWMRQVGYAVPGEYFHEISHFTKFAETQEDRHRLVDKVCLDYAPEFRTVNGHFFNKSKEEDFVLGADILADRERRFYFCKVRNTNLYDKEAPVP